MTFGDDAKLRIVGLDGSPRTLGPVDKLELDQNTILLKSRILSAVRDAVGDDQNQVFRDVEKMLFGKLSHGQFTEKRAARPLTMRDLRNVVDVLAKSNVGSGLTPMTLKGGQVKAVIAPRIEKTLQKDPKALSARIDAALRGQPGGDPVYTTLANPGDGYGSSSTELPGVPKQFAKDYCRSSGFILPGIGKVSYRPEDGMKAADDMAKAVTRGRVQHFRDLEGKDLRKTQFVMALACQTTLNPVLMGAPAGIFGTDGSGTPLGGLMADNSTVSCHYEEWLSATKPITIDLADTCGRRFPTSFTHLP